MNQSTIYRLILLVILPLALSGCSRAWNRPSVSIKTNSSVTALYNGSVTPRSLPNQGTKEIFAWKTYRNEEYGFEVKYPCNPNDTLCPPTELEPQGGFKFDVSLPTIERATHFHVSVFDEASITDWNQSLMSSEGREGDGQPFPFDVKKLNYTFQLRPGKECNLALANSQYKCEVVLLEGSSKALKVIANYGVGGSIEYLVPHAGRWYDLRQFFYDEGTDFLLNPAAATPEQQVKLSASEEVRRTFSFIR